MIAVLLACSVGGMPADPPVHLDDYGKVPDFALVDQTASPVTLAAFAGHIWLADFMFTSCPDICPTLSARMATVAVKYAAEERMQFVSFSVDPQTDTPARLLDYSARFDAKYPTWRFLTGETTAMRKVVVDGFRLLMDKAPATDVAPESILHGSKFILIDASGTIRAYPDPEGRGEIEAYVDLLLKEG